MFVLSGVEDCYDTEPSDVDVAAMHVERLELKEVPEVVLCSATRWR